MKRERPRTVVIPVLDRFISDLWMGAKVFEIGHGLTMSFAPHAVRSVKLSGVGSNR